MPAIPQHVSDYIREFNGVLSPEACADLISRFEANSPIQQQQLSPGMSFTEINVTRHWPQVDEYLKAMFHGIALLYAAETGLQSWWVGEEYAPTRMKRYYPGESFRPHLDRVNRETSRRSLVMFLYLNDVAEGGETSFPQWGIARLAHTGKLLAFPAGFPYVHEGNPPLSGPKYILGTYKLD